MRRYRFRTRIIAGCVALCGFVGSAFADSVTPQQLLAYRPHQEVHISTPTTEAEIAACKVDVVKGQNGTSAWVLRDGRGLMLRKIADTKGTRKPDTYSYYLDGLEVYREIDTNQNGKIDQYRWVGPGGMRWGVDINGDGVIDGWRQISAEEVSQEIVRAISTRNIARLQALVISENELKAIKLPAAEVTRIQQSIAGIPAKFQNAVAKSGITSETKWEHLETSSPQCLPADSIGSEFDLIRYESGRILHQTAGKHDWLQTGEMIQIGRAWRLIGGPTPGYGAEQVATATGQDGPVAVDEAAKPLIDRLGELDKRAPKDGNPALIVRYNLERAELLAQIAGKVKPEQAEQWIKQIADCYSAAAQAAGNKDKTPYQKLVELRDRYIKGAPGSPLTGYIVFREMTAEYAAKIDEANNTKGADLAKVQEIWRGRLKSFVESFPTADDAPDAILQLGMITEFAGKEAEAKNWYEILATKYAKSPLSAKARGALRRITAVGQPFELTAPQLGAGTQFDIRSRAGKIVVVYYWASWNHQCAADFFKLKTISSAHGIEIVTVNVDASPNEAIAFLEKNPCPGAHLYQQPGGLDGTLATQYGINVLPSLFLIGKDGKVISNSVQMSSLEDEIKKAIDGK